MNSGNAFAAKTVIVTGGASGIGSALGALLFTHGAQVVLADIDGKRAQLVARELREVTTTSSGTVVGTTLDVCDAAAVQTLVGEVAEQRGGLDLLFNNAGISMGGPTHELSPAHWERMIDVNIRGTVNGVLAAYPRMVEQGYGHIINTASGAALSPPPFVTTYAATKSAVVGLSMGLRPEAALHGVKVSVLCPGAVETPILDRAPEPDLPMTASLPVSARMYLAALRQKPIPAERFARRALQQVVRNKAVIVVPGTTKSLWYLQRLSPWLVGRISRGIARKVDRELVRPRTSASR